MTDPLVAAAATWPPAAVRREGAVTLRDGAGGGQRVAAATVGPGWTAGDLDRAIAAMPDPLFQVQDDLLVDAELARRGFVVHDPVVAMAASLRSLPSPSCPVSRAWPPESCAGLWSAEGIGAERLAVMRRAPEPKSVLAIANVAVAFVACHDGWAVLHALAVARDHRRRGLGRAVTLAAADFGRAQGAQSMALLVTTANHAARALYASLGLTEVGGYHYRRLPMASPT